MSISPPGGNFSSIISLSCQKHISNKMKPPGHSCSEPAGQRRGTAPLPTPDIMGGAHPAPLDGTIRPAMNRFGGMHPMKRIFAFGLAAAMAISMGNASMTTTFPRSICPRRLTGLPTEKPSITRCSTAQASMDRARKSQWPRPFSPSGKPRCSRLRQSTTRQWKTRPTSRPF